MRKTRILVAGIFAAMFFLPPVRAQAFAVTSVDRVDSNIAGTQSNSGAANPKLCRTGRYVGFASQASNLVPGDTNYRTYSYVKDLQTGDIQRVGNLQDGSLANDDVNIIDFSGDCNLVLVNSRATNILPAATAGTTQFYLYNRLTHAYTLVTAAANGTVGNGDASVGHLSADGLFVVFESQASDLSPDDTNTSPDIYLKNISTGAINVVSRSFNLYASGGSHSPQITSDAHYVIFSSNKAIMPEGGGTYEIYRYDVSNSTMLRIAPTFDPNYEGAYNSHSPQVSDDGDRILYESSYSGSPSYQTQPNRIYKWTAVSNTSTLMPMTEAGVLSSDSMGLVSMSKEANIVIFDSYASDVVSTPSVNGMYQLYVRDILANTTTLLSQNTNGIVEGNTGSADITPNGQILAYNSTSTSLVYPDNNGAYSDVFVVNKDLVAPQVFGLPDRQPNANGWFNDDVTIQWTSTDLPPSSGTPTAPPDTIANIEGINTYISAPSCDPAGNCATGSVTIKLDKTPPTITNMTISGVITVPAFGTFLPGSTTTINASVADNLSGISRVEYYLDIDPGQGLGSVMAVNNGNASATANVGNVHGQHTIFVRSLDRAGNWSTKASVTFTRP